MTVKELIDELIEEDQDALVYTLGIDDNIALLATSVKRNVLDGKENTVLIF